MSHYKLDVAKWRCGDIRKPESSLGLGSSKMLNAEGYMCCLGQFAKQKGVTDSDLLDEYSPRSVAVAIRNLYDEAFCNKKDDREVDHTNLSSILMYVNDDPVTTPREKIQKIKATLKQHGHTLEVANEHLLEK